MKKQTEKKTAVVKTRERMRSFEADPDNAEMLKKAEEGGVVFKELMNRALRKFGPATLREMADEMRKQADLLDGAAAHKQNTSSGKH